MCEFVCGHLYVSACVLGCHKYPQIWSSSYECLTWILGIKFKSALQSHRSSPLTILSPEVEAFVQTFTRKMCFLRPSLIPYLSPEETFIEPYWKGKFKGREGEKNMVFCVVCVCVCWEANRDLYCPRQNTSLANF